MSASVAAFETITIALQIVAVVLNGAIVLCTLRKKSLMKCPSTKFVFSLCLSHLLISFLVLVISTVSPFLNKIHFDDRRTMDNHYNPNLEVSNTVFSLVILYLTLTVSLGTSFTVALISVERYITIARPMKYKTIITSRRCCWCIVSCWFFSLALILAPILNFGNQMGVYASTAFAVPTGELGLYYAFLFSITTLGVLAIMMVCYGLIFRIAREKCQKVQIGHFTSPVSSISSDWPSSVYSSQGQLDLPPVYNSALSVPIATATTAKVPSTPLSAGGSALLQYALTANLGKHIRPLRATASCGDNIKKLSAYVPSRKQSSTSADADFLSSPRRLSKFRRWTTFLQQNYNSPRKTVSTIALLISSLMVTQIPLSIALFCTPSNAEISLRHQVDDGRPTFLYFCLRFLFAVSSIANPILYGFLNRNIRSHLWKFVRVVKRRSQISYPPASYKFTKTFANLRQSMHLPKPSGIVASLKSPTHNYVPCDEMKGQEKVEKQDAEAVLISNVNVNCQDPLTTAVAVVISGLNDENCSNYIDTTSNSKSTTSKVEQVILITCDQYYDEDEMDYDEIDDYDEIMDEELLSLSSLALRKPSQDSGADMRFSDDSEFEEDEDSGNEKEEGEDEEVAVDKIAYKNKEDGSTSYSEFFESTCTCTSASVACIQES